ncbi:MAG: Rap1a/Tai family immunity protein [Cycloclasticus sp.]
MKKLLLITLWLMSFQLGAVPAYERGSSLLPDCKTAVASSDYDTGRCYRFISSTVDTYASLLDWGQLKEELFCLPDDLVSVSELVIVATSYLEDHPEKLSLGASRLILTALREKFPCR